MNNIKEKKRLFDGSSIIESMNELSYNEQVSKFAPPLSATNKNALTMAFSNKKLQGPQLTNAPSSTFSMLNNYFLKSKK